ncbi:MAG: response regulator transcription factor [Burkholderiales bacterium]
MKRVLVAEDEPSIVLSLEFLLREAGFEVITAQNGATALALAEQHKPDLVVLDIMLPLVNGFEVCRALRADPALRGLRIVMLTARGREREVEKGLALGADAYITKPFATRELVKTIKGLLEPGTAA